MRSKGFTLIELAIAIAILAILLRVAVPSFKAMIANNRIATQTNEFVSDIAHARAEAVRRNQKVSICKSNTGTSCVTGASWKDGWVVFTDPDSDGVIDTGEIVLRQHSGLTAATITAAGFDSGNFFQFLPSGITSGVSGGAPSTAGSFQVCISGYKGRYIYFNTTGRINITPMTTACP